MENNQVERIDNECDLCSGHTQLVSEDYHFKHSWCSQCGTLYKLVKYEKAEYLKACLFFMMAEE